MVGRLGWWWVVPGVVPVGVVVRVVVGVVPVGVVAGVVPGVVRGVAVGVVRGVDGAGQLSAPLPCTTVSSKVSDSEPVLATMVTGSPSSVRA